MEVVTVIYSYNSSSNNNVMVSYMWRRSHALTSRSPGRLSSTIRWVVSVANWYWHLNMLETQTLPLSLFFKKFSEERVIDNRMGAC